MSEHEAEAANTEEVEVRKRRVLSDLQHLCSYYLRCLSKDISIEVCCFATSYRNDLDYAQIDMLPVTDSIQEDIASSESVRRLVSSFWSERNQKELRLGYPLHLNRLTSRRTGKDFFMVEPLLLLGVSPQESGGRLFIDTESLDLNPKAVGEVTGQRGSDVLHEILMLIRDLGLENSVSFEMAMSEMAKAIEAVRPEWTWQEHVNPENLNLDAVGSITQQGIYNRAALFLIDRAPYTRGLERELNQLSQVDANSLVGTALWHWLTVEETTPISTSTKPPLLAEPFPLNLEQYQSVQKALISPHSTVTGPPGTGKSQVVASIVINALLKGQRVLFSSKNNKAVDVVVERVNNLTGTPLILRLGDKSKMEDLSQFLQRILNAPIHPDTEQQFREVEQERRRLISELEKSRQDAEAVITTRNDVDDFEKSLEQLRADLGDQVFTVLFKLEEARHSERMKRLNKAIGILNRSDRRKQGVFTRIFWKRIGPRRIAAGQNAMHNVADIVTQFMLPVLKVELQEENCQTYCDLLKTALNIEAHWTSVSEYAKKLRVLQKKPNLYELAHQQHRIEENIASLSMQFLHCWQQLLPKEIDADRRRRMGEFAALTKLLARARGAVTPRQMARYYELLPSVSNVFTCWAVSSLSARGRIPFQAGFFDLLVVDEASQCDIASALPLLYRSKRAVIIGDPQQLSHITKVTEVQDIHLLSQFDLDRQHHSWSYSAQSLFALAMTICDPSNSTFLKDHHRSHERIITFSNKEFYGGYLRIATHYDRLKLLKGEPVVRWIDARGTVIRPFDGSAINQNEAERVVQELKRIIDTGYDGTIGVVSPFRAQTNRIRDLLRRDATLNEALRHRDFLVDTVHRFQGDERDLMVFSPVVSNSVHDGAVHFLARTGNLFNVAITRARSALIVVGDRHACSTVRIPYLNRFVDYTSGDGQAEKEYGTKWSDADERLNRQGAPIVSEWENVLQNALETSGIQTESQYPVEQYWLDVALLSGSRKLDIEVDGERYHRAWDGELLRRDMIRNRRLIELGWDVIRFWVYEIRDDLETCIQRVRDWLDAST